MSDVNQPPADYANTYQIQRACGNCAEQNFIRLPKGQPISGRTTCTNCGCKIELKPYKELWK
jgi:hypothetical protein